MGLLDHLHLVDSEDIGRGHGGALVRRIGIGLSGLRYLAMLFHDLRRTRLENRAVVVAHQHLSVADAVGAALQILQRPGTGGPQLPTEGRTRPDAGEIGNGRFFAVPRPNRQRGAGENRDETPHTRPNNTAHYEPLPSGSRVFSVTNQTRLGEDIPGERKPASLGRPAWLFSR